MGGTIGEWSNTAPRAWLCLQVQASPMASSCWATHPQVYSDTPSDRNTLNPRRKALERGGSRNLDHCPKMLALGGYKQSCFLSLPWPPCPHPSRAPALNFPEPAPKPGAPEPHDVPFHREPPSEPQNQSPKPAVRLPTNSYCLPTPTASSMVGIEGDSPKP